METIAGQQELIDFAELPLSQRQLNARLRGILAETALTGRIRYGWALVRPLVSCLLASVLREFEADASVDGPPPPLPDGDTVADLLERLEHQLQGFQDAPWTLQRLAELLLEPRKQYSRLHKLAAAVERLLTVTTEVGVTPDLPPPPLLDQLAGVNDNPRKVYFPTPGGDKKRAREEDDGLGLVGAMIKMQHSEQRGEAEAGEHWGSHATAAASGMEAETAASAGAGASSPGGTAGDAAAAAQAQASAPAAAADSAGAVKVDESLLLVPSVAAALPGAIPSGGAAASGGSAAGAAGAAAAGGSDVQMGEPSSSSSSPSSGADNAPHGAAAGGSAAGTGPVAGGGGSGCASEAPASGDAAGAAPSAELSAGAAFGGSITGSEPPP